MKLDQKVAIVTGAGRGIGRAIAFRFAEEGAQVVVAELNVDAGEETAALIRSQRRDAVSLPVETNRRERVENMVAATLDRYGHIDILVNNAGIAGGNGPFLDIPDEVWQKVIDVNLTGVFLCSQVVARAMVARNVEGCIINIGSLDSFAAERSAAAYAAAKGGVLILTKAMAVDLAPHGIRVNCIAPGSIRVERNATRFDSEPLRTTLPKVIPLGHPGRPEDIAAAAVFLASDDAHFITGASLMVDGGFTAYVRVD
jgi:NAD(P)-dependent dehydrogenase (short-subunit alcohol dehydrogenase family)